MSLAVILICMCFFFFFCVLTCVVHPFAISQASCEVLQEHRCHADNRQCDVANFESFSQNQHERTDRNEIHKREERRHVGVLGDGPIELLFHEVECH